VQFAPAVAPGAGVVVPASQSVQAVWASASLNVPTAHGAPAHRAVALQYHPIGQGASAVALAGQKRPAAHGAGTAAPGGQKVPHGHGVGAQEPWGQLEPAQHAVDPEAPAGQ
jgi:hypothetical protein